MATVFPSPTGVNSMQQSPPQMPQMGAAKPRTYTPYVFQPNFLKQQMRQTRQRFPGGFNLGMGTGANSVPLNQSPNFNSGPLHTNSTGLGPSPHQNSGGANTMGFGNLAEDPQRKKSGRKVIDWTSSCILYLENRKYERDFIDVPETLPDSSFTMEMQSVAAYKENPVTSITSKFVRSATNKMKCPVYKFVWTPDGRRLVTGSASGEFTLWNGTAFNFETILQAHDCPVRAMAWSKHDYWLITGDNQGYIKYWQLNMNNVKMYQAHKDQACRSVSFGPTDHKFTTASDDGTVRVWDFLRCHEERILRGHGADVKQALTCHDTLNQQGQRVFSIPTLLQSTIQVHGCLLLSQYYSMLVLTKFDGIRICHTCQMVDWHPFKSLILSASKDLHTPLKLWDPKSGQSLATIHAHKGTVMDVRWNQNGNWFLSASRDHLVKLYDVRNLKQEMQIFRGHKKEAFSVSWHPIHEDLFATGGSEGSILFWQVGEEKEAGALEGAHDSLIWSLAWHPLGHVLVSGSNDHSTKFWARNRPGDSMRDRYNMTLLPQNEDSNVSSMVATTSTLENEEKSEASTIIPGMGDADVAAAEIAKRDEEEQRTGIPGLDWSYEEKNEFERKISAQQDRKKMPYARPVPRSFVAAWEANKEGPPPRPRSPYWREWDDYEHRHRRPYDRPPDRHPRDYAWGRREGSPFRPPGRRYSNGPDRRDEDDGDEKIYVDGVEVGPDYVPDDMKQEMEPEPEDIRPPMRGGPGDHPRGRGPRDDHPRGRRNERPVGRGRGIPNDERTDGFGGGSMEHPDRIQRDDFHMGPGPPFQNEMNNHPARHFSNIDQTEMPPFTEEYSGILDEPMEQGIYYDENGEPLDQPTGPAPYMERMDMGYDPPERFSMERGRGMRRGSLEGPPMRSMGMRGRGDRGVRGRGFPNRDQGWGGRGRRMSPPHMRRGMRPPR